MSEMIERVRAAMLKANAETIGVPYSHLMEAMARAAIAAMREPTEAMVEAAWRGTPSHHEPHEPDLTWRAMIDAALKE